MSEVQSQSGDTPDPGREPARDAQSQAEVVRTEQLKTELSRGMETREKREDYESLWALGDRMYEEFKGPEFAARDVLTSISEAFNAHKNEFDPKMTFINYIKAFGPGLVKLCQQKLVDEGHYDLGKYGEKQDGVDGKLGKMTNRALRQFFQNLYLEKHPEVQGAPSAGVGEGGTPLPPSGDRVETREAEPPTEPAAEPAVEPETAPERLEAPRLTVSPKGALERRVLDQYRRADNSYRTRDLPRRFGESREAVERFITNIDPVTKKPFEFLGCPIAKPRRAGAIGLRLETMMMLKIVEEKLKNQGIKWRPKAGVIGGFEFRGMKIRGQETKTLSSHAFGIAIDMDPAANGPIKDKETGETRINRGTIPDQVAMAFVESGFAWGLVGDRQDYPEFGNDAMHFQLRGPTDTPEMQEIIQNSEAGRKYWAAIQKQEGAQVA